MTTPPILDRSSAWTRFLRNRLGTVGMLLVCAQLCLALITLPFALSWYDLQVLDHVRHPPRWHTPVDYSEYFARPLEHSPLAAILTPVGQAMHSAGCWFGLDALGRSLLYRCLMGGLISMAIGFFAAGLSITIGVLWGATAALCGGKIDLILMRLVDVLYGLPYILLVILLRVALEAPMARLFDSSALANIVILLIAIGANSWLTMARVIRGQVLSLKEQLFVQAARVYGASHWRILKQHLLPNLIGPIAVYGSLIVPQAILSESFLSFLGIGIQPPLPSWGLLVADGLLAINTVVNHWWLLCFPGALLSITLLSLNFIGDSIRDAFDPQSERTWL